MTEEEDADGGPEESQVWREGLKEGGKEERKGGIDEEAKHARRLSISLPPSLPPSSPPTSTSSWPMSASIIL